MTTRRVPTARNTRQPTHSAQSSSPRLSSHTFTLIASWRGQLLICTVVLILGAIYFVVREPIRKWRHRQRERLSRAFTAELLSMDQDKAPGGAAATTATASATGEDKDKDTSTATSSAIVSASKNARERAREKRKEAKEAKKRGLLRAACPGAAAESSSIDSSPALIPTASVSTESVNTIPSTTAATATTTVTSAAATAAGAATSTNGSATLTAPTITLEASQSEGEGDFSVSEMSISASPSASASPAPPSPSRQVAQLAREGSWPMTESPEAGSSRLSIPALEIDLSDDLVDRFQAPLPARPVHSRVSSGASYSIMPDDGYLPSVPTQPQPGKRKKRKSKARSGTSDGIRTPEMPNPPTFTPSRSFTASSDDASPPQSVAAILSSVANSSPTPGSPPTPRRRRNISIGGMPMTPALELLITNHERTIDSLRAEIGLAKAEEGRARDDETHAREELRRSRATEDRMRADYERARKARDRAESDTRRLDTDARRFEAEILVLRNRFETLTHMYHAVCNRLREVELGAQDGSTPHVTTPLASPYIAFPAAMAAGAHLGFLHYNPGAYPSPIVPHGFPTSPYPRRADGALGVSDLAGPLTPGQSTIPSSAQSQASSPYPSDLTLNTSTGLSFQGGSSPDKPPLSAAELRRLHITSSVLKKKTREPSDSGDSNTAVSTKASEPMTTTMSESGDSSCQMMSGLGISQMDVQSTFPSANGNAKEAHDHERSARHQQQRPSKQGSTSSASSEASSGRRHQILITPSNAELFHTANGQPLEPLTSDEPGVFVRENGHGVENGHAATAAVELESKSPKSKASSSPKVSTKKPEHLHVTASDTEFAPMFASLAHTPQQLAEIARIREEAIRERERRTRARSVGSNDL